MTFRSTFSMAACVKAVTRTREMGFIRKDAQNRWHATDKLKELPS